jgi:hypothetical protein
MGWSEFALAHPNRKNKSAVRVGHPKLCGAAM